jgi:mannose-6-phosphate isomerase-like protein (cupin superfamily)
MDRTAKIVAPEQGRVYSMGRMRAVFKADLDETANNYSVSEWWLEPRTHGPHQHFHDDDHVYYVLEGTLDVQIGDDWSKASKGAYILIPGGTPHSFENRSSGRAGFISFTAPGGFEERMPAIEADLASTDLKMA